MGKKGKEGVDGYLGRESERRGLLFLEERIVDWVDVYQGNLPLLLEVGRREKLSRETLREIANELGRVTTSLCLVIEINGQRK